MLTSRAACVASSELPADALDILQWLEPLCLGDALHGATSLEIALVPTWPHGAILAAGRAATVPVLLLLDRFAGRQREEARRESQLANDPRYTSEVRPS